MAALAAVRRRDRVPLVDDIERPVDVSTLTGTWINTETRSQWLARIEARDERGVLMIHPFGGGEGSPNDWGESRADMICATAITSRQGGGYTAAFSVAEIHASLQATLNQGLLVVVVFNRLRNGGRVTREFFRRMEA